MSFERALEVARADVRAPMQLPTFARVEAAARWQRATQEAGRPPARMRWLATLGSAIALLTMTADAVIGVRIGASVFVTLLAPLVLLGLSMVWLHRASMGAQLVSRAVWWAHLVLGVGWSFGPPESLPAAGALLAVGSGIALLVVGRSGLERSQTRVVFDPIAFRGTVLLSMILGLGDAMMLGNLGLAQAELGLADGHPAALLSCASLLAVGVWGLSRLRTWSVLVNLVANLGALGVLLSFGPRSALLGIMAGSAAVQLVLPLRMFVAFWRGAAPRDLRTELRSRLAAAVIVGSMLIAVPVALFGTYAPQIP